MSQDQNDVSGDVPASGADDYGADANPTASAVDRAFDELDRLVSEGARADDLLERLEADVIVAKAARADIYERQIPEQMDQMKLRECVTRAGWKVTVESKIRASLPSRDDAPELRAGAIKWLIDHGHGALVKNKVSIELDRGQDDRADELAAELLGRGLPVLAEKDVHASTLAKLVRELLDSGRDVPRDLIRVFDQRAAKIKSTSK